MQTHTDTRVKEWKHVCLNRGNLVHGTRDQQAHGRGIEEEVKGVVGDLAIFDEGPIIAQAKSKNTARRHRIATQLKPAPSHLEGGGCTFPVASNGPLVRHAVQASWNASIAVAHLVDAVEHGLQGPRPLWHPTGHRNHVAARHQSLSEQGVIPGAFTVCGKEQHHGEGPVPGHLGLDARFNGRVMQADLLPEGGCQLDRPHREVGPCMWFSVVVLRWWERMSQRRAQQQGQRDERNACSHGR